MLGNLISLNLPVRLVFEGLWLPQQSQQQHANARSPAGPPMRVTFRLQVHSIPKWRSLQAKHQTAVHGPMFEQQAFGEHSMIVLHPCQIKTSGVVRLLVCLPQGGLHICCCCQALSLHARGPGLGW